MPNLAHPLLQPQLSVSGIRFNHFIIIFIIDSCNHNKNSTNEINDTQQLVVSRSKRTPIFPKIDLDNVIGTIFGVKGWPTMLTNQVGWASFRIFGYIVGGK